MSYKLTQYQIDLINQRLPQQLAALKYRYPVSLYNAANHWNAPLFPKGYIPKSIAIYYDESPSSPSVVWKNGELKRLQIEEVPIDPDVILVLVDNTWTYVQVQGKVVLDKTVGICFPPELTQHELMLKKIVHSISIGKYKNLQS